MSLLRVLGIGNELAFRNAKTTKRIQLAKLTSCATLTGVIKGEGSHAGFDEPRTDRIHSDIGLLKLICGSLGHRIDTVSDVSAAARSNPPIGNSRSFTCTI